MACRTIGLGGGMTAIICGPRRAACSTPGCGRPHESLCDYPVTRKGKLGTCNAKLCDRCRQPQEEPDRDFCPPHQKVAKRGEQPVPADAPDPTPGTSRVHIETGRVLYVVSAGKHGGTRHVTFSTEAPTRDGRCGGVMQTVPLDKWLAKTRAP